ncbi:transketolase [Aneurinibacillus sp. Ricciae_BoGa-3]|uniref:transketolase n=1 Tax=Aneurinibacillus sp. Ricciae_BoGa-3 TaxID=3022697 RepID=UPI00233FC7D2|nr:transketolase [Aneurinibacillus sp. Ricciae_BoGa-3]WCK56553.1 transketolase [Aneurinibacillus sp. Ricciae_BoGa-3]
MINHTKAIDELSIATLRTLSIDQVEKANSGHPGLPMGAAPMAYVLWTRFMRHNPANPHWFNRDRFVLSAGHGSALLYSLLHVSGYDVTVEDLKNFRQWESRTPGHPEVGFTPGVDATTGPLGQGISMAVGMAMAERFLAATYNREGFPLVDHYTYSLCGDGDLMEGVSAEAASLAGHLRLGRLIVLYDSNNISLDGETKHSFTENVAKRFEAYGWQVLRVENGNDPEEIQRAISEAQQEKSKPTIIEVRTIIGYGSPNKGGKSVAHGSPLGAEEVELVKKAYNWDNDLFHVPEEVRDYFGKLKEQGANEEAAWDKMFQDYKQKYPQDAVLLEKSLKGELPDNWDANLPVFKPEDGKIATRDASGKAINAIAKSVPFFLGGSADLASSTKTNIKDEQVFTYEGYKGRNIWFGVREHGMGAAMNGMSLHGGVKVFGGTFFVFSDYLRPAIRLAALMKQPVIYVFTHDSIAVGEDGPTHEPIEQLPSLRTMPGLTVMRPADANETMAAYHYALSGSEGPVAMALSRQGLPVLENTAEMARQGVAKGAYIVSDSNGEPQLLLLATGSEVHLAVEAQKKLAAQNISARVVSMPSWELFEKQPQAYKDSVLPPNVKARLAIEMAAPFGWERYVGDSGKIIGIPTFGASAPGDRVMKEYGFSVENVVAKATELLSR